MKEQMLPAKSQGREEENKKYDQKRLKRQMKKRNAYSIRETVPGSGRAPSRTRTGTTAHFALWKADLAAKSSLQKIKLDKLADAIQDETLASGFALLYVAGIRNVFTLSQKDIATLLSVRGIDLRHLGAVETYLLTNNVKTRWTIHGD